VNDLSSLDVLDHDRARATQPGLTGRLRRAVAGSSAAVSCAGALLDAGNRQVLWSRVAGRGGSTTLQKLRAATGPRGNRRPLRAITDAEFDQQLPDLLSGFRVGGIKLGAFERTLAGLAGEGVEVVVALLPFSPRAHQRYRALGGDPWATGVAAIRRAAQAQGAAFVDVSGGLADEHFADPIHPGPEGVARLSRRLGRALAERSTRSAGDGRQSAAGA